MRIGSETDQRGIKFTDIFHCKTLQNFPKLGFWVWKYTIWNPDSVSVRQGCQMAYFKTQNPNLCKFWRVLQLKMLLYFIAIWPILLLHIWYMLCPFGIFDCCLLYFHRFCMLYHEKYGNPAIKRLNRADLEDVKKWHTSMLTLSPGGAAPYVMSTSKLSPSKCHIAYVYPNLIKPNIT
jgi:hypothetical protein